MFGIGLHLRDLFATPVLRVTSQSSTALYAGSDTVGDVGKPLGNQLCSQVLVQNSPDSSESLLLGSVSAQTLELPVGANLVIECDNIAKVYVKAKYGVVRYNYLARS